MPENATFNPTSFWNDFRGSSAVNISSSSSLTTITTGHSSDQPAAGMAPVVMVEEGEEGSGLGLERVGPKPWTLGDTPWVPALVVAVGMAALLSFSFLNHHRRVRRKREMLMDYLATLLYSDALNRARSVAVLCNTNSLALSELGRSFKIKDRHEHSLSHDGCTRQRGGGSPEPPGTAADYLLPERYLLHDLLVTDLAISPGKRRHRRLLKRFVSAPLVEHRFRRVAGHLLTKSHVVRELTRKSVAEVEELALAAEGRWSGGGGGGAANDGAGYWGLLSRNHSVPVSGLDLVCDPDVHTLAAISLSEARKSISQGVVLDPNRVHVSGEAIRPPTNQPTVSVSAQLSTAAQISTTSNGSPSSSSPRHQEPGPRPDQTLTASAMPAFPDSRPASYGCAACSRTGSLSQRHLPQGGNTCHDVSDTGHVTCASSSSKNSFLYGHLTSAANTILREDPPTSLAAQHSAVSPEELGSMSKCSCRHALLPSFDNVMLNHSVNHVVDPKQTQQTGSLQRYSCAENYSTSFCAVHSAGPKLTTEDHATNLHLVSQAGQLSTHAPFACRQLQDEKEIEAEAKTVTGAFLDESENSCGKTFDYIDAELTPLRGQLQRHTNFPSAQNWRESSFRSFEDTRVHQRKDQVSRCGSKSMDVPEPQDLETEQSIPDLSGYNPLFPGNPQSVSCHNPALSPGRQPQTFLPAVIKNHLLNLAAIATDSHGGIGTNSKSHSYVIARPPLLVATRSLVPSRGESATSGGSTRKKCRDKRRLTKMTSTQSTTALIPGNGSSTLICSGPGLCDSVDDEPPCLLNPMFDFNMNSPLEESPKAQPLSKTLVSKDDHDGRNVSDDDEEDDSQAGSVRSNYTSQQSELSLLQDEASPQPGHYNGFPKGHKRGRTVAHHLALRFSPKKLQWHCRRSPQHSDPVCGSPLDNHSPMPLMFSKYSRSGSIIRSGERGGGGSSVQDRRDFPVPMELLPRKADPADASNIHRLPRFHLRSEKNSVKQCILPGRMDKEAEDADTGDIGQDQDSDEHTMWLREGQDSRL